VEHAKEWKLPERLVEKAHNINGKKLEGLRRAILAGVKIAYGTDAGVFPHGRNGRDFHYLVECGMSPMQAIQAATINASTLLSQSDKIGSLQPGRFADIIAVNSDPMKNIDVLENILFVMKGGIVYRGKIVEAAAE
jgi:imidazolonepropionase-like amidohydrolase